jgi:ribosomal protein S4
MARYTGPKTKVSRRYGVLIHGSPKAFENKNYPPGQHGPKGSRRKLSDYALALAEKQKLRYFYGLMERQFRGVYEKALKRRGSGTVVMAGAVPMAKPTRLAITGPQWQPVRLTSPELVTA